MESGARKTAAPHPRRGGAGGRLRLWLESAPRDVPQARLYRTSLRTLHLIAVATLYGGHVHGVAAERLVPALLATVGTGAAFVAFEVWRAPLWLVQLRGLATFAKVGLVAAVGLWWEGRLWLLTAAIIVGAVVSHAPGRLRYYSLLHGGVAGPRERG